MISPILQGSMTTSSWVRNAKLRLKPEYNERGIQEMG
jgi:hypothetical protein